MDGRAANLGHGDETDEVSARIRSVLREYWGFDGLRPLQEEAIRAGLSRRDSLVVMPTGGGKSLCYQAPPLISGAMAVVVSPLIALMKDQVDGLKLNGVSAGAMHGNLSAEELGEVESEALDGKLKLLFVAPERLLTSRFLKLIARLGIQSFAIDEAHCISQWGHDFRPEYRRLRELRRLVPTCSLHAFTATATPRVRDDIVEQLDLRDPLVLVGTFDRPNLTYRVTPRERLDAQLPAVLRAHGDSAAIVYCLSRKDTETVAGMLTAQGFKARAYHAGMDASARRKVQDAFSAERLNVVCATVAFGMGIDRSNVRCVVHATMPKSVEAYQQETGRAGRDGLPAECVMLYSPADGARWRQLIARSADEAAALLDDDDSLRSLAEATQVSYGLLDHMQRYAESPRCRHRALSEYFGQAYGTSNCGACDACLGELSTRSDAQEIAQKIVSCVYRVCQHSGMAFGAGHLADVLTGSASEKIRQRGHDTLSTYGALRGLRKPLVAAFMSQLIDQEVLVRVAGEYPVVELGPNARGVLKNEITAVLTEPKTKAGEDGALGRGGRGSVGSGDPTTDELFEELRALRRRLAEERNVPPYVVFSDASLRDMAARRPGTLGAMLEVRGVGERKLAEFGEQFLGEILTFCQRRGLKLDLAEPVAAPEPMPKKTGSATKAMAMSLFAEGLSVAEVIEQTQRAASTVHNYLRSYIEETRPPSIARWVDDATYDAIEQTARKLETDYWMPIRDTLGEKAPVDSIFLVLAHLRSQGVDAATGRRAVGGSGPERGGSR